MTGEMARILPKNMYNIKSRGQIKIKGVNHEMETFLLPLSSPKRNSGFGSQTVTVQTQF
jgi:hypothetical protein